MPAHKYSRVIGIDPHALFAPADGRVYTPEDGLRVLAQQPLDGRVLPELYLVPLATSTLKPPTLRYGWRLGRERLMRIIEDYFPDAVVYRNGPELNGKEEDEEYIKSITPEEWERLYPSVSETLYGDGLALAICERLGISEDSASLFDVQPLYDNDSVDVGLTIGSNYLGILKEPYYSQLKAIVSPNEDAKWYLDHLKWKWRRQVPANNSSKKRSSKS